MRGYSEGQGRHGENTLSDSVGEKCAQGNRQVKQVMGRKESGREQEGTGREREGNGKLTKQGLADGQRKIQPPEPAY